MMKQNIMVNGLASYARWPSRIRTSTMKLETCLKALGVALILLTAVIHADAAAPENTFKQRLQPTSLDDGFEMEGYWVWGMSVIKGEDGLYHGFASRWSNETPFGPNWVTNSEVVHATAEKPEGPYTFQSVVLKRRGKEFFDGLMTHNPTIHKSGDTYLLFYTGSTYSFPFPREAINRKQYVESRIKQRVGMATAKSPWGPWERSDNPILLPRPGKWDSLMTTNPAICVKPDGRILLVYKSAGRENGGKLKLGVAEAAAWDQPFRRLRSDPIFQFEDKSKHVEDPYMWWNGSQYELVMKDMNGKVCGQRGGGIYATSANGIDWNISEPPLAYPRKFEKSDGSVLQPDYLERAQVLVQEGEPTHLFVAIGMKDKTKKGGYEALIQSRNICIPLK